MSDRQFVRKHYANAILELKVIPRNTLRAREFYNIMTDYCDSGNYKRIASGETRESVWKNAKRKIQAIFGASPRQVKNNREIIV
jgi:hypothetical protein